MPSTIQRGVTPQKTPLPKATANRVLFTAEKQRNCQGINSNSVALHNDKKWVQEQTQRITEHLLSRNTLGGGGISTDFLNRGLRQMSIKQFVAIINYFLGFIWGNRYTVGSNHVDDIINILQKLQYPHPLNKSWLKTPNTQHSFGNVIVLFDFLMDFVPPENEQEGLNELYFELKETEELSDSRVNKVPLQVADFKFQQELLSNSEKGFMLWDKHKDEELANLQEHTCNLLVQKRCGLAHMEALELEIEKSKKILKSVKNEMPSEDKGMLEMNSKLSNELKKLSRRIESFQSECDTNEGKIKELATAKIATVKEVDAIKMDIKDLQEMVNSQSCSIEQRDQMMRDVARYKQMLGMQERTIQDLQNRFDNEQILQSKSLKQLNDKIEKFNAHMREVKFSDIMKLDSNSSLNETNLELSLRPKSTELDKLVPRLEQINKKALHTLHSNKEKILKLQEQCKHLKNVIDAKLHTKLNALRTANTSNATNLQKLLHTLEQEECKMLETIQNLEGDVIAADKTIEELQSVIKHHNSLTEEHLQANEQTMQNAEQKHRQSLEQRRAFLKAYDEMLEERIQNDELQQLSTQVQLQEEQLKEMKKYFNS